MRQFVLLFILLLLSACSGSNNQSNGISIAYEAREEVAPARWVFTVLGGEDFTSYQWQFSDDISNNSTVGQTASIEHVFAEPGLYRIRLTYLNAEGEQGQVETQVLIGSGSISGTITAALDSLVDVDTRDPREPDANNDSFESAQSLSASTRLSGVVDFNDNEDFYQVQLQQFQRLSLQVADKNKSGSYEQVRLALFKADKTFVISSETDISTGRSSTILVPAIASLKDNYFIKLTAIDPSQSLSGAHSHGNYSLTIEAPVDSAVADYALGEVNIMLKPERHQWLTF